MPLPRMLKNLFRTQEILTVFVRHGFGDLLQRMGLDRLLKKTRPASAEGEQAEPELLTTPRRFRNALEELGGGFVKLGQVLSTHPDILPARWIEELTPLQDSVTPLDFETVRNTLEEDLGPAADRFGRVDPTSLASASVAQVHRGSTREGKEIAIKIRKPGIKKLILQDCDILEALAELLERHVPESRSYRPLAMVKEFRKAVSDELDFQREGENLDRFRANFGSHPEVTFPAVYWDLTTERVLTMEWVQGIKVSLKEELVRQGVDTKLVARNLATAILRQILEFGFFHGDPHPGNLLVLEKEAVCFLDCGMVGRLDERTRDNLVLLVAAGLRKDTEALYNILSDMNAIPDDLDRALFNREVNVFLERYYGIPLKRLRLSLLIDDLNQLVRKFRIEIPSDMVLVGKALITLEGVGRALDPDFDAISVAEPFIKEMVLASYGPRVIGRKLLVTARDLIRFLADLPSDLRELTRTFRENQLRITVEHKGLREAFALLDHASRRLSLSLLTASIIVGSSIIVLAAPEPRILGVPIIGLLGFAVSGILGLWLIISLRKTDKS